MFRLLLARLHRSLTNDCDDLEFILFFYILIFFRGGGAMLYLYTNFVFWKEVQIQHYFFNLMLILIAFFLIHTGSKTVDSSFEDACVSYEIYVSLFHVIAKAHLLQHLKFCFLSQ